MEGSEGSERQQTIGSYTGVCRSADSLEGLSDVVQRILHDVLAVERAVDRPQDPLKIPRVLSRVQHELRVVRSETVCVSRRDIASAIVRHESVSKRACASERAAERAASP